MMRLGVISILPEIFSSLHYGICGRAIERGLVQVQVWNPRDWASLPHRQVDDKSYGGGPGMVMMYEPLLAAVTEARSQMGPLCKVVYLSPQGRTIKQHDINTVAQQKQPLVFLAGRYEGIDERFIENHVDEEWSLGDFVLSGGELGAMVYIDAIVRLLPGSLGNPGSATHDSFMNGLLDHPHYTRPVCIEGSKVPDVLCNGNHQEIKRWRKQQALGRTWMKRPDLLEALDLNDADRQLLVEFILKNGKSL